MPKRSRSRRRLRVLLAGAVLALLAGCAPRPPAPPAPRPGAPVALRLVTDWKAEAEQGGFYQALATGEYRRRGLDVRIIPGGPGVNVPQLLAAGQADLGIGSNAFIVANLAAEGVPAKAVMASFQHDPLVLMAHPSSPPARDPGAFAGDRPILVSPSASASVWPWLKARFGYREGQRRTYSGDSAAFIADGRAVQEGYVTSEPFTVKQAAGFEPQVFLLNDYGYGGYAGLVLAADALLKRDPAAVQAFTDATAAGWRSYLNGDPAPGDALIRRDDPEMTEAVLAQARDAMRARRLLEDGPARIGAMSDARWRSFGDFVRRLKLAPDSLDITRAYTLEHLPRDAAAP